MRSALPTTVPTTSRTPRATGDPTAGSPTAGGRRTGPRALRGGLALGAATALVLLTAPAASAHVRVFPDSTTAGGYTQLVFRVPTESETAGTVSLRVDLPTDTPLTSVRTQPMPGWTAVVETGPLPEPVEREGATLTEAPLAVVWTADAGTDVGPGEYEEFELSVGPLPEAGTELVLPAHQTYSDGEVVLWGEEPTADGTEPELPAPVFVTTAAPQDEAVDAQAAVADTPAGTVTAAGAPAETDPAARWLGGGGLALGAAALVTAGLGRRRSTTSVS